MTETKTFPTRTLISVYTACGVPGVTFSMIHEAVEHLVGEPVWTHQLAQRWPWDRAREEINRQCIGFSTVYADALRSACEGNVGEEREAAAEAVAAIAGVGRDEFTVARGSGLGRSDEQIGRDAMGSLLEMAGDRPVLAVEVKP